MIDNNIGDRMRKYLVPVTMAMVLGIFMGIFLIKQYDGISITHTVFDNKEKIYFIQQGVYSSEESMKSNVAEQLNYIYEIIGDKYYVYIAITQDQDALNKIKDYFATLGYSIYVKEYAIDNKAFTTILKQYDSLLNATDDKDTIKAICSQVLAKYEELVLVE